MFRILCVLELDMYGFGPLRAGRVRFRRCEKCRRRWAELVWAPGERKYDPEGSLQPEAVLLQPWKSQSGAHSLEVTNPENPPGLPLRPVDPRTWRTPLLVVGRFRFLPRALVAPVDVVIAKFTSDRPFGHVVCVIADEIAHIPAEDFVPHEECGTCYRDRAVKTPDYQQGHLYVTVDDTPRLRAYGPGVETIDDTREPIRFFNHYIQPGGPFTRVLIRGNLASIEAREVSITSPDHPDQPLTIRDIVPKCLNLYHPWPRDGAD